MCVCVNGGGPSIDCGGNAGACDVCSACVRPYILLIIIVSSPGRRPGGMRTCHRQLAPTDEKRQA